MVSMKDVAAACGVSVATVSKALSNHRDIGEIRNSRSEQWQRKWDITRISLQDI